MAEQVAPRRGREGSRWINERPSAEDVAKWFSEMPLHAGMDHAKYVAGVTLIPAKDTSPEIVGYRDDGTPAVAERENRSFTPYMKVETRVAYFWDLIAQHADDGWIGVIEPVDRDGGDGLGLPPGFFRYQAAKPDGKTAVFVGYAARVSIVRDAQWIDVDGRRVLEGLPVMAGTGTKIVATATRWDADVNALMKAETGAIGRALGFAGILVLPGSGVATAEDMQEALAHSGTGGVSAEAAELPPAEPPAAQAPADPAPDSDVALRQRAAEMIHRLEADHPAALEQFRAWARGRRFGSLNELKSPALKGVVRKLEKTLDEVDEASPAGSAEGELADVGLS